MTAFGLLQHETRLSVLNFSVRKAAGSEEPLANKERLLFVTGYRCPILPKKEPIFQDRKLGSPPRTATVSTAQSRVLYPGLTHVQRGSFLFLLQCDHGKQRAHCLKQNHICRTYLARPVFSTDEPGAKKAKMERFLQPGQYAIATVYAPIGYGPLPLLAFRKDEATGEHRLAASGELALLPYHQTTSIKRCSTQATLTQEHCLSPGICLATSTRRH